MDPFWSLGLLERSLADPPKPAEAQTTELAAANANIDQALKELASGGGEPEPPIEEKPGEPAGAKPKGPAAAEAEAKKAPGDEAKKAAGVETNDVVLAHADQAEPSGSTKDKDSATPPRRPSPARANPRQGSASVALVAKADDFRPQYVEAQVLIWADTFAKRDPASSAFKGPRGDLLGDVLRTRRLAEKAAASDERIGRWITPLVEAGDAHRRRAQDGLFAGDTRQFPNLAHLLDQARERDRQALEVGDHASQALDLVEQIEAEAPLLRRVEVAAGPAARRGAGPDARRPHEGDRRAGPPDPGRDRGRRSRSRCRRWWW